MERRGEIVGLMRRHMLSRMHVYPNRNVGLSDTPVTGYDGSCDGRSLSFVGGLRYEYGSGPARCGDEQP